MAVVKFDVKDLEELTHKKMDRETLENRIPMLGCEFESLEEGTVEYEIFPNRPDLLSVEGFARALRYFLGVESGLERYKTKDSGINLEIEKSIDPVRPCISASVVRNIDIDDHTLRSLMQLQEKIHKTFGRERKKVAIGIHDLDKVEGPFTYKAVDPGEIEFVPLGSDKEMNLKEIGTRHPKGDYVKIVEGHERWPVIVDKNDEVLSFPPVINGRLTEVSEKTENIFIDVTGTDQKAVERALNIVSTSLGERGGEIETVSVGGKTRPDLEPNSMEVDIDYVNSLLDLDMAEKELCDLAGGIGFGYDSGTFEIPPYRTDVMHPIDIVEDIAISYGYGNFETSIPDVPGIGSSQEIEEFTEKVKELMVGFGFQEVKTTVLTNKDKQFTRMERDKEEVAEMENALSEDYTICRKYIMPELLDVLRQNQHRSYPQSIFEVGDAVEVNKKSEVGAENRRRLGVLIIDDSVNYVDLASVVSSLIKILGKGARFKKNKDSSYMASRSGTVYVDGTEVGTVGEIHPKVLENWSIEKPVVGFEIDIDLLVESI